MALRRYILDIIIVLIIATLVYYLWHEYTPTGGSNNYGFTAPGVEKAKQSQDYRLRLTFNNPTPLYGRTLKASIIHTGGEEATGNFILRDVRLWRTNGDRIINDEFKIPDRPLHITIYDTTDDSVLFESDIDTNLTTITSGNGDISSIAKVEVVAP